MNSRDLCTIAYIPDLIEANIDAFKIEGRMRHPHYVEIVAKTYREAIQAYYDGTFTVKKVGWWVTELKKVYNRGFTPGFYFKRPTEEDHQHNYPYNLSHYRYIRVGKIIDYNSNNQMATILLDNGYIGINSDVVIMGKRSDTYIHQQKNVLKYKGKIVDMTPRGTKKNNITIKMKVNDIPETQGFDKVYIFTNKTYKRQKYSL
jgi:putative protease